MFEFSTKKCFPENDVPHVFECEVTVQVFNLKSLFIIKKAETEKAKCCKTKFRFSSRV